VPRHPSFLLKIKITIFYISLSLFLSLSLSFYLSLSVANPLAYYGAELITALNVL
jgi:hypothetical protein